MLECKKAFLDLKNEGKHLQFFKNSFSKNVICYKNKFEKKQLGSTFAIIFYVFSALSTYGTFKRIGMINKNNKNFWCRSTNIILTLTWWCWIWKSNPFLPWKSNFCYTGNAWFYPKYRILYKMIYTDICVYLQRIRISLNQWMMLNQELGHPSNQWFRIS